METDDPALGLSAVESALPPSRGVCALWPGSGSLLFLVLCSSSYRPPLQSISAPSLNHAEHTLSAYWDSAIKQTGRKGNNIYTQCMMGRLEVSRVGCKTGVNVELESVQKCDVLSSQICVHEACFQMFLYKLQ